MEERSYLQLGQEFPQLTLFANSDEYWSGELPQFIEDFPKSRRRMQRNIIKSQRNNDGQRRTLLECTQDRCVPCGIVRRKLTIYQFKVCNLSDMRASSFSGRNTRWAALIKYCRRKPLAGYSKVRASGAHQNFGPH